MPQQGDEAGFHLLGHGANLLWRDVVVRHGTDVLQQHDVFGQLLLPVPLLQIVECVAHERLLFVLQIGVAVDPPIEQIIALVVDQFEGAATRQQEQGDACQTQAHMADNSAK